MDENTGESDTDEFIRMRDLEEVQDWAESTLSIRPEFIVKNVGVLHRNLPLSPFFRSDCDPKKGSACLQLIEANKTAFKKQTPKLIVKGAGENADVVKPELGNTSLSVWEKLKVLVSRRNPFFWSKIGENPNFLLNKIKNGFGIQGALFARIRNELIGSNTYSTLHDEQVRQEGLFFQEFGYKKDRPMDNQMCGIDDGDKNSKLYYNAIMALQPKCAQDHWQNLWREYHRCRTCGVLLWFTWDNISVKKDKRRKEGSRSHLKARAVGGSWRLSNMESQCKSCNKELGDKHLMRHKKFNPVRLLEEEKK